MNATTTAKHVSQTTNSLPDKLQCINLTLGLSVERHVWKEQNLLLARQMSGIEMLGETEIQILKEICEGHLLQDEIARHNSDPVQNHVDANEILIKNYQFAGGVVH